MNVEFLINKLETGSDWTTLAEHLGGAGNRVVKSILHHLVTVGCVSYLIESRYIDRDYSSDYRRFYAQTFRTYDRHCKRVHFFAEDIGAALGKPLWADRVEALQLTSRRSYLGFSVIRPLPGARIGRTVLHAKLPGAADLEPVVTCRANIRANLLGAELDVTGTSFMQQDSRVGACAQVAIWTGARHMHQRYRYNWLSVADITRLAAPTTSEEASSLPAGSDFLTSERMIRAIHEMGFQPLCFQGRGTISASILPYVESGLPVIVGLEHGNAIGHAVTVIGRVFAKQKNPTDRLDQFVAGYIAHDDQAGPYMLLPSTATAAATHNFDPEQLIRHPFQGKPVELNMKDHAVFAVALMPVRAFSTARAAEATARGAIQDAIRTIPALRGAIKKRGGTINETLLDEFIDAYQKKKIVLRTYLTSAAGYRYHMGHGTACNDLKDVLARLHLPHFNWVTEISTVDSYNQASPSLRRMYGHSILDATSTGKDEAGLLALHLPGFVALRDVTDPAGIKEVIRVIQNDSLYECREKRFDH